MPRKTKDTSADATAPVEADMPFDEILGKLRGLVEKLESSSLSLEESLVCFEEGMKLCQQGTTVLDGAEKKVERLLQKPEGATEPFDS